MRIANAPISFPISALGTSSSPPHSHDVWRELFRSWLWSIDRDLDAISSGSLSAIGSQAVLKDPFAEQKDGEEAEDDADGEDLAAENSLGCRVPDKAARSVAGVQTLAAKVSTLTHQKAGHSSS